MGVSEEVGKVSTVAVTAMQSQPLAIALLIVNCAFLAFAGYVLGEVSQNAAARNLSQMNLIEKLANDIRDCRQGPKNSTAFKIPLPPFKAPPIPINDQPSNIGEN